jgi:hypothetical protein
MAAALVSTTVEVRGGGRGRRAAVVRRRHASVAGLGTSSDPHGSCAARGQGEAPRRRCGGEVR